MTWDQNNNLTVAEAGLKICAGDLSIAEQLAMLRPFLGNLVGGKIPTATTPGPLGGQLFCISARCSHWRWDNHKYRPGDHPSEPRGFCGSAIRGRAAA